MQRCLSPLPHTCDGERLSPSLFLSLPLPLSPSLSFTHSLSLFRSLAFLSPSLSVSSRYVFFRTCQQVKCGQTIFIGARPRCSGAPLGTGWSGRSLSMMSCQQTWPKKIACCYHSTVESRYLRAASSSWQYLGHKKIVSAPKEAQCNLIKLLELKNVLLNINRYSVRGVPQKKRNYTTLFLEILCIAMQQCLSQSQRVEPTTSLLWVCRVFIIFWTIIFVMLAGCSLTHLHVDET